MSQLICAMAKDGLLFRGLAQIHARTGTPVMAIMSSVNLTGEYETHSFSNQFPNLDISSDFSPTSPPCLCLHSSHHGVTLGPPTYGGTHVNWDDI